LCASCFHKEKLLTTTTTLLADAQPVRSTLIVADMAETIILLCVTLAALILSAASRPLAGSGAQQYRNRLETVRLHNGSHIYIIDPNACDGRHMLQPLNRLANPTPRITPAGNRTYWELYTSNKIQGGFQGARDWQPET
jgi:hypothetical protein